MVKISDLKVTSQIFSELLGVSRRTVESWKREGLPHSKRGIPFVEGFQWWRTERFKELDELRVARTRREIAKARIAELDAKEKDGTLILKNEAVKWVSLFFIEIKQAIWTLPRRFAAELAALTDEREIELLLQREVRRILEILTTGKKRGMPK